MRRCLLVPDRRMSIEVFRAHVREYIERHAYPNSVILWVHVTSDRKRAYVSVEKVFPRTESERCYPEYDKPHLDITHDLEVSPYGDFTEVPV